MIDGRLVGIGQDEHFTGVGILDGHRNDGLLDPGHAAVVQLQLLVFFVVCRFAHKQSGKRLAALTRFILPLLMKISVFLLFLFVSTLSAQAPSRVSLTTPDPASLRRDILSRLDEGTLRSWQSQEDGLKARLEFSSQKELFGFLQRLPASRLSETIEPESLVLELEVRPEPFAWPDFRGALLGLVSFTLRVAHILVLFLPLWLSLALAFAIWRREKWKEKIGSFFSSLRKGRALPENGKI